MNRIILGLAVVSTILMMICAICTMAAAHPVVTALFSAAFLVFMAVNEKPFREGHDFVDRYVKAHTH